MAGNNFHVFGAVWSPAKADAILLVYANAVLTLSVTFRLLQTIARRRNQKRQTRGVVDHIKLANRDFFEGTPLCWTDTL